MKSIALVLVLVMSTIKISLYAQESNLAQSIIDETNFFEEKNGLVAVEAEFFYKQSNSEKRQWYRTTTDQVAKVGRDEDAEHIDGASNKTYIEILPDTRVTHSDELIRGENFSNEAGKMAIAHYKVKINNPGRYYVWVRAFSTGSEDNGVHVGLNGEWPDHGQRMQWCEGKNQWKWDSKQRTKEVHCGVPKEIYLDIEKSGVHDIQFSMREDGFEFDKYILTTDPDFKPVDQGPGAKIKWSEPSYYKSISTSVIENKTLPVDDFPVKGTGYYQDAGGRWLAIKPHERKEAETTTSFNFKSANYDVVFVGVGENDGQSTFTVLINGNELGSYSPSLTHKMFEEGKDFNALWENVTLNKGDEITVVSKIGSSDGKEWARARWSGLIFAPAGRGKEVMNSTVSNEISSESNAFAKINPPKGRIAIVADGNSPDPDDLGATVVKIALLRATGLEERLVHYSHSCDLVRVNRISEDAENERHALMQTACDVTARRWGGFDGLKFYDAKWQMDQTIKDLASAINSSTDDDPLWIIEAGEPDIIGYALDASDKEKHQHVKVITHHPANDDAGDFYSWQQILDFGVEEVRIPDQNVNLKVNIENWDWAKDHPDPRIQWLWLIGKIAEVDDVVKFQKGKWDCSDAGMLLYWLTGATNGGLKMGSVDDVKSILLGYIDGGMSWMKSKNSKGPSPRLESGEWESLLDDDLSKWTVWTGVPEPSVKNLPSDYKRAGEGEEQPPIGLGDPMGIYKVTRDANGDHILNISGEVYAGLTSKKSYSDYHMTLLFKWGEKKYEPRLERKRDCGLLYHCYGSHGAFWNVWKRCLEYQIQEGDFGDLYNLGGTFSDVPVGEKGRWDPTSNLFKKRNSKKSIDYESPHGEWTRVDLYVIGDKAIHVTNGHVVLA
ncbi:MAG: DUF1080 domain-containing protein, partial [Saprospiraceae bacterium]|nr:DUF1080 domain-containing protein [Saprospiraceae bacterium]